MEKAPNDDNNHDIRSMFGKKIKQPRTRQAKKMPISSQLFTNFMASPSDVSHLSKDDFEDDKVKIW